EAQAERRRQPQHEPDMSFEDEYMHETKDEEVEEKVRNWRQSFQNPFEGQPDPEVFQESI
ncbi:hypothetical protein A2U01_0096837, partial [Trifolium medium]|nr:hypothetical protein [Trifolium medium]